LIRVPADTTTVAAVRYVHTYITNNRRKYFYMERKRRILIVSCPSEKCIGRQGKAGARKGTAVESYSHSVHS
jgi:hypothetical protein